METEQISQNLVSSLNSLRQSGQGMTVSQMMSSGISFADIISMMINGTNQNSEMTGIFDPQLLQNTQQTASENIRAGKTVSSVERRKNHRTSGKYQILYGTKWD